MLEHDNWALQNYSLTLSSSMNAKKNLQSNLLIRFTFKLNISIKTYASRVATIQVHKAECSEGNSACKYFVMVMGKDPKNLMDIKIFVRKGR